MEVDRRSLVKTGVLAAAATMTPRAFAARHGLAESDYMQHDAIGLGELIARKEISPIEALDAAIARANKVNPAINAITLRLDDFARNAIANDLPDHGPLRGVPFLLKDLGEKLTGTVTSEGSRFFKDAVADHDSTLVARYRDAGLVIFGKTASPEFGGTATTESLLWGDTRNPWNLKHSTGGSSGGAAAVVAAGIVPAAHASDGGGSIRIPAANCGLFGMKPSRGRVPTGPDAIESWMGLTARHAISRSVRDSAMLMDLTAGPEAGSRVTPYGGQFSAALKVPVRPLKIALMEANWFGVPLHPECKAALDTAAKLCENLGHHVEPTTLALPVADMMKGMSAITAAGTLVSIHEREKKLGRTVTQADLEPISWDTYQSAKKYTAEDLYRGRASADTVGQLFDRLLTKFDLILSPVTAVPPPLLGALSLNQSMDTFIPNAMAASCYTLAHNISGLPAMSVPLHWTADGLPVGSMFAGRFGDEATLFQLAAQLEQTMPWKDKRPKL